MSNQFPTDQIPNPQAEAPEAQPASEAQRTANHQNPLTHGLFTAHPYIQPHEQPEYAQHLTHFDRTLAPAGPLELTFASEITAAAWRLRRCLLLESDPATTLDEPTQKSIERARSAAQNTLRKAIAELRRLQTERQTRNEIYPQGTDLSSFGLASTKEIKSAAAKNLRDRLIAEREENEALAAAIDEACSPSARLARAEDSFCKTPAHSPVANSPVVHSRIDSSPVLGRNTPCPCKSGLKYKRCCGTNAPAILNKAA